VECCAGGHRPQSDADIARDTVATLNAGGLRLSKGEEVAVPACI